MKRNTFLRLEHMWKVTDTTGYNSHTCMDTNRMKEKLGVWKRRSCQFVEPFNVETSPMVANKKRPGPADIRLHRLINAVARSPDPTFDPGDS